MLTFCTSSHIYEKTTAFSKDLLKLFHFRLIFLFFSESLSIIVPDVIYFLKKTVW